VSVQILGPKQKFQYRRREPTWDSCLTNSYLSHKNCRRNDRRGEEEIKMDTNKKIGQPKIRTGPQFFYKMGDHTVVYQCANYDPSRTKCEGETIG
jgi:hypothetical protein